MYSIVFQVMQLMLFIVVAVQISKPVETTSEFQIQNEDFPALPGSKPPTTKTNGIVSVLYLCIGSINL